MVGLKIDHETRQKRGEGLDKNPIFLPKPWCKKLFMDRIN